MFEAGEFGEDMSKVGKFGGDMFEVGKFDDDMFDVGKFVDDIFDVGKFTIDILVASTFSVDIFVESKFGVDTCVDVLDEGKLDLDILVIGEFLAGKFEVSIFITGKLGVIIFDFDRFVFVMFTGVELGDGILSLDMLIGEDFGVDNTYVGMLCVGKFTAFVKLIGVKLGMFAVEKVTLVIFIGAELGGKCILEFDLYKLVDVVLGANVEGKFAAYIFEWGKFEGVLFVITCGDSNFFCLEVSIR
jgi:hypothetical protein